MTHRDFPARGHARRATAWLAAASALALALAFLIEYFDDRLRDGAEAERLTGVPVIGSIPRT